MQHEQPDCLFVYGTLLPGRENERVLAPLIGRWERAHVFGRLYPDGIGAALGYPVLILDAKGEQVSGQLFFSAALTHYWQILDAFEGPAYRRQLTTVRRQDDSTVSAFVYTLRGQ